MGRRERGRRREQGAGQSPAPTSDYTDPEGNVLTLRDELSGGTLRQLHRLDAKPAASAEDRWQRRVEFLFERLAVRWTVNGVPTEGARMLLARFRAATADERAWVRDVLRRHCREWFPDVEAP